MAEGEPAALPENLVGLDEARLADLDWVNPRLGYAGQGFQPVDVPDPVPPPLVLTRLDFFRLFTAEEETAFNITRKRVQALAPDDYGDPTKAGLVAMERFLNRFDATPQIEMNNAETLAGIDLLVALNVITAERAAVVKTGAQP